MRSGVIRVRIRRTTKGIINSGQPAPLVAAAAAEASGGGHRSSSYHLSLSVPDDESNMGGGHDMHGQHYGHNGGVKGFVSNLVHGGGGHGHGSGYGHGHGNGYGHGNGGYGGGHGYPPPAAGAYPHPHGGHGYPPPATYPAHSAHYGT